MSFIKHLPDDSLEISGVVRFAGSRLQNVGLPIDPSDGASKAYVDSIIGTPDKKAATFVVSPTPGVGDYTSIQDALNALPAQGGLVFLREGIYPISATITIPPKPVAIVGCGPGSSIINLGTNLIAAFTLNHDYNRLFSGFSVYGNNGAGQEIFHFVPGLGTNRGVILISNVQSGDEAFGGTVETVFARTSPAFTRNVHVVDCFFRLPSVGTPLFVASSAVGEMRASRVRCANSSGTLGGITGLVAIFHAVDCQFGIVSGMSLGEAKLTDCILDGNGVVSVSGASRFNGVKFRPVLAPTRSLDILASAAYTSVMGCEFGATSSAPIRIAASHCSVIGNFGSPGIALVEETGAADYNAYFGNRRFVNSGIIGVNSVVEGSALHSLSGVMTLGSFVQYFAVANPNGIDGIGTIKNTGANSLEVRESVTDFFGVGSNTIVTVLAGNDYILDPDANFGTARPPYSTYTVEVRHPVAATTFDLKFNRRGDTVVLQ